MQSLLTHKASYEASIKEKEARHDANSRDVQATVGREKIALREINEEIAALEKRETTAAAKK